MSLNCMIGHHRPLPQAVRNQGFDFSRCRCCGSDMIRSGRSWRRVPRGFRVVWRARPSQGQERRAAPVMARHAARPAFGIGFVDMVLAALRVLLWSLGDGLRGFNRWLLALPNRAVPVLRLPAPALDPFVRRRVAALDTAD